MSDNLRFPSRLGPLSSPSVPSATRGQCPLLASSLLSILAVRSGDRGSSPRGASGFKASLALHRNASPRPFHVRGEDVRDRRRGESRVRLSPRLWLALALLVVSALIVTLFVSRQLEIARRERRLDQLELAQIEASQTQLELRDRLASADDPVAIEQAARERLGLVMPGEIKVIFVEEPSR